jgi:hypothetical protein
MAENAVIKEQVEQFVSCFSRTAFTVKGNITKNIYPVGFFMTIDSQGKSPFNIDTLLVIRLLGYKMPASEKGVYGSGYMIGNRYVEIEEFFAETKPEDAEQTYSIVFPAVSGSIR